MDDFSIADFYFNYAALWLGGTAVLAWIAGSLLPFIPVGFAMYMVYQVCMGIAEADEANNR